MSTCKDCRFCENKKCVKFNIVINEDYKVCNDFAASVPLNEDLNKKIKLYD